MKGDRKRIVYLCDWLPPDFGAVGQYAVQAAAGLARAGHDVLLVGLTSGQGGDTREAVAAGRLTIRSVPAPPVDRSRWRKRAAWTLRTDLRLLARAWPALRRCDEIVFTGSPPFLLHLLGPLNLLLRKRLVYRITDFYPECLSAALGRRTVPLKLLQALTDFWRRRVHEFQVLGGDARRRLREAGIAGARIRLRRDTSPVAIGPDAKPLALPDELTGFRVLLYSGNWGVAHEYETFVEAYRRHHARGDGRVALWINAVGVGADAVETALQRNGLPVHRSRPVPLEQLARLLVTPHAHLITLRDAFVGYVLPSKVYGCIESGRPVLFVGSETSDVHALCEERMTDARYLRCDVGDVDAVLAALERLAQDEPRTLAETAS